MHDGQLSSSTHYKSQDEAYSPTACQEDYPLSLHRWEQVQEHTCTGQRMMSSPESRLCSDHGVAGP